MFSMSNKSDKCVYNTFFLNNVIQGFNAGSSTITIGLGVAVFKSILLLYGVVVTVASAGHMQCWPVINND